MKKYQVFISSTYEDLKEERKEVIQALLELDCIPVGMEMFPAADDDQWTLIKDLIVDCDYYILIVGGRYGSLSKDGISYTQQEYEFAVSSGIPCISFLHKSPDQIVVSKTDKDTVKAALLESFKSKVSEKLVRFWETPEQLGSIVSRSLIKLIKAKPRVGWVKANRISSEESSIEILKLKGELQILEEKLKETKNEEFESLSQGEDIFNISYNYKKNQNANYSKATIDLTWNVIIAKTCPILIDEASENDYKDKLNSYIQYIASEKMAGISNVVVVIDNLMSILIQLKALGIIERSLRNRSVKDKNTYWKLTSRGDLVLTNLRAIKRKEK